MAGQGRLDGHAGRFRVANLADHDDVGVLAQDRAQGSRESHPDGVVHLHLVDAVELVLDRVLDGHDVLFRRGQEVQDRVQRRGLAAAGRPGHQHDAVRLGEDAAEAGELLGEDAKLLQRNVEVGFVENPQDDFLAEQRGHGGDAQVDLAALGDDVDAALLGQAAFGDVHFADDLDARDDGGVHAGRGGHQLAQVAVDAIADAGGLLGRLDVDVAGPVADGRHDRQVDQVDDRAAVDHLADFVGGVLIDGLALDDLDLALGQGDQERVDVHLLAQVLSWNSTMLRSRARTGLMRQPVRALRRSIVGQRLRLGHRDGQRVADLEQRQGLQAAGFLAVEQAGDGGVDQPVAQLAGLDVELLGQGAEHGLGREDAQVDELLAQALVVLALRLRARGAGRPR